MKFPVNELLVQSSQTVGKNIFRYTFDEILFIPNRLFHKQRKGRGGRGRGKALRGAGALNTNFYM